MNALQIVTELRTIAREHRRAMIAAAVIQAHVSSWDSIATAHNFRDTIAAQAADIANATMAALEARPLP